MSLLVLKLILTPLLIAAATLAVRRWGFAIGGLFTGLPLTSGPISLFLAIEQGPQFAEQVSQGMLLGMVSLVAFCVAYARTARGPAWFPSLAIGIGVYFLASWGLSFISLPHQYLSLMAFLLMWAAFKAAGPSTSGDFHAESPWWDIPARMVTATAMVFLITGGAQSLGPRWSGLIAPFPVFTCIMGVFAQKQNGAAAAHRLLRAIILGCFSAVAFFVVIGFTVERITLTATYLLATAAALSASALGLAYVQVRSGRQKTLALDSTLRR